MANISVTNTFVNGATADATEVNQNFTDIINGTSDGTKDFSISALTCAGAVSMNGAVTLGNATADDITITGSIAANIPIKTDGSFDIGGTALGLDIAYFGDGGGNTVGIDCPSIASNFIFTLPAFTMTMPTSDGAAKDYMQTDASGAMSFVGGPALTAKTTTYTATTADKVITCATSSVWTLTLYAASGNAGRTLKVKKTSSDTNTLTIDGNGAETIDGSVTYVMSMQYEEVDLICDGSNWHIFNKYVPSINARYSTNAGQTIADATTTIIDFEDSSYDSHSSVTTGSTWKFTAPKAGKYQVNAVIYTVATTADALMQVTLHKGGVETSYLALQNSKYFDATSNQIFLSGSDTINLAIAEYVDVRLYQGTGGNLDLTGNGALNYIAIERIGD
jgi:hypothetical protein